jgi:hypothetical protein
MGENDKSYEAPHRPPAHPINVHRLHQASHAASDTGGIALHRREAGDMGGEGNKT